MRYVGEEIYKVIPNRYPLMLLNSLTVEEDSAIGQIDLKGDEWFFQCHFPGRPIMPLSLLIESMSQVFIAIFLQKLKTQEIPVFSSLTHADKISLKDKLEPGDKLRMEASLLSFRRGIAKGVCKAFKNEREDPIMEFEIVEALPSQMIQMR